MSIEYSAGRITATAFTDGFPVSITIECGDDSIRLFHGELNDLHYVLTRMLHTVHGELHEGDRHAVVLP